MKYIFLSIFLLLATQPVPVTACDMHDAQEMSQMQHGNMQEDHGQLMDCCDPERSEPSDTCDPKSHCSVGAAPVVAINNAPVNVFFSKASQRHWTYASHPPSTYSSPPFRPPIS
jgi:hypothetical protein